jgi:2,4-dienoyl-CoA reductase-like NADH-dependent reductase (Old Yellow Enzyme family)
MDKETIQRVIAQYSAAAKHAIEAGFDGVEIHGEIGK